MVNGWNCYYINICIKGEGIDDEINPMLSFCKTENDVYKKC